MASRTSNFFGHVHCRVRFGAWTSAISNFTRIGRSGRWQSISQVRRTHATFAAGNDIKDLQKGMQRGENIWWILVARVPHESSRIYCMVQPFPLLSPFRPEGLFADPLEVGGPATGLDAPGTGGAGADVLGEEGTGFG